MQRIHRWTSFAIAAALASAAPLALAQTNPATQDHPDSGAVTHTPPFRTPPQDQNATPPQNQNETSMPPRIPQTGGEMGQHDMTGTVESVSQDGIVKVRTAEGTLKVHFPDAASQLKKGEKITLHLAYSVNSPASASSM